MAQANNDTTFTDDDMEAMRAQVGAIRETEGLSQADLAKEAGIAESTFASWLAGKYAGRNDSVAANVQIWLTAREERKRTVSKVQRKPEFQATPTAQDFIGLFDYAQSLPDMVVIAGAPGTGKTTAMNHYAATNPNVWPVTMQPCTSTIFTMLVELADAVGVTERAPVKLNGEIGRKIADRGGLIIVDEAQHADTRALDQLRSLHDLHRVGIALVGNQTIYGRLDNDGRKANFAQLVSRIGMRVNRNKPKAADMCLLIAAWGVTDKEEVRLLKAIADKPGALRNVTKVMQVASMLAAGEGVARTIDHIRRAAKQLGFENGRGG